MPTKTDSDILLICVGLFVIIIVAMMFSTGGLSPYDEHNAKSLSQYPYEGFASAMDYFYNRNSPPADFVPPVTTATNTAVPTASIKTNGFTSYASATTTATATKLEGFQGLQSGTYSPEQRIDDIIYSSAGPDCNGKKYGQLTTSKGYLCLSDKDVTLLTTRGGNSAGSIVS